MGARLRRRGTFRTLVTLAAASSISLACASTQELDPAGGPGDPCHPNGTCNDGLVCVVNTCTTADAGTDAATGGTSGAAGAGGTAATGGVAGSGGSGGTSATGGTSGSGASGGTGATSGGGSGGTGATGGTATGGTGGTATGGTGGTATGGTGGTATGGTGGGTGGPPPPGNPTSCTSCGCCDPWPVNWTASSGATYYNVIWQCSIFPQHVINVGNVVTADLCSTTVGTCNSSECANSFGSLKVQACNTSGCSAPVSVTVGLPIACGGGCCC